MSQRLRVWYCPQVPMKPFQYDVPNMETGRVVLDAISKFSLFEFENKVKPDYADAGGIEEWNEDAGEWWEVDDQEDEVTQ